MSTKDAKFTVVHTQLLRAQTIVGRSLIVQEIRGHSDSPNSPIIMSSLVGYDSGVIEASNVQSALDQLGLRVDVLEDTPSVTFFNNRTDAVFPLAGDYDAEQITYDNATSGLTGTNAQDAVDELATFVRTFNSRNGDVVPLADDYNAEQITFSNGVSGLTATNTQDAVDEIATTFVKTFNARNGDVLPVADDYSADQVSYTGSLVATNVQTAIEELNSIPVGHIGMQNSDEARVNVFTALVVPQVNPPPSGLYAGTLISDLTSIPADNGSTHLYHVRTNGMSTSTSNRRLVVDVGGLYKIDYSISGQYDGALAADAFLLGYVVSTSDSGSNFRVLGGFSMSNQNDTEKVSSAGSTVFNLAAGEEVSVAVATIDTTISAFTQPWISNYTLSMCLVEVNALPSDDTVVFLPYQPL